jgi:hypothetical protein
MDNLVFPLCSSVRDSKDGQEKVIENCQVHVSIDDQNK